MAQFLGSTPFTHNIPKLLGFPVDLGKLKKFAGIDWQHDDGKADRNKVYLRLRKGKFCSRDRTTSINMVSLDAHSGYASRWLQRVGHTIDNRWDSGVDFHGEEMALIIDRKRSA